MKSEMSSVPRLDTFAVAVRSFLKPGGSSLLRRSSLVAAMVGVLLLATMVLLLALRFPLSTVCSLGAGVAVRFLCQHRLATKAATSDEVAELAHFEFDGSRIDSAWNEESLKQFTNPWKLRVLAGGFAGGVCFLGQRWEYGRFGLLSSISLNFHWLAKTADAAAPLLIVATVILFLWWRGLDQRWCGEIRAIVQRRADEAAGRILATGEIDGLQAGIEVLWKRMNLDRECEYRRAVRKYIEANTAEAVFNAQTVRCVVDALVEVARQDMERLSVALTRYQEVECAWKVVESIASEFGDAAQELRIEELKSELNLLSKLAFDRRWSDLQSHADWLLQELRDLQSKIRRSTNSVPRMSLPPGSDPYRILGVRADTPIPTIKKLRMRLAQLYHPDVSESIDNSTKMAELNAAYDAVMRDRSLERR